MPKKKNPKLGDKRLYDYCVLCGEKIFEVYDERTRYGGSTFEWRVDSHVMEDCIAALRNRIEELENKCEHL